MRVFFLVNLYIFNNLIQEPIVLYQSQLLACNISLIYFCRTYCNSVGACDSVIRENMLNTILFEVFLKSFLSSFEEIIGWK